MVLFIMYATEGTVWCQKLMCEMWLCSLNAIWKLLFKNCSWGIESANRAFPHLPTCTHKSNRVSKQKQQQHIMSLASSHNSCYQLLPSVLWKSGVLTAWQKTLIYSRFSQWAHQMHSTIVSITPTQYWPNWLKLMGIVGEGLGCWMQLQ